MTNLGLRLDAIIGRDNSMIPFHKFGRIVSISQLAFETIWPLNGVINYPPAATVMNISSDSADDTAAGSGARTVKIQGLDENGDLADITVEMSGTTIVPTTGQQFLRAFRGTVITTGTPRLPNDGTIYIYEGTATLGIPDDATKIYAVIPPLQGQTQQASVTVPRAHTGVIEHFLWTSNAAVNKEIDLRVVTRRNIADAPFNVTDIYELSESVLDHVIHSLQAIPALTDIEMMAKADQVSTNATGTMDILFVK